MKMDAFGIQEMGKLCIRGELPPCITKCPVHVDVRGILGFIQQGNFDEALKLYCKSVLFPEIISRICDHPCEDVCLRKDRDEAIAIQLLEKACVDFGSLKTPKRFPVPPKDKRIAVIGAGLSGLGCAYELKRKGYQVDLYEKTDRLGGRIWSYDPTVLPREALEKDLIPLSKSGVNLFLSTPIHDIEELEYDAFFIGFTEGVDKLLTCTSDVYDPISLAIGERGVFGVTPSSNGDSTAKYSPITSLADGMRAARSIERYFQKVSLHTGREKEGSYYSKTHVTIPDSPWQARIKCEEALWYQKDQAVQEAKRCWQCACIECQKVCSFIDQYQLFPDDLAKTIGKNMYAYPSIGKSSATSLINSCSLCGLCQVVCPGDLDLGEACLNARRIMVERNIMPMAIHDFSIRDMLFSNGEDFFLAKHQPGMDSSSYLFFPGCQLGASKPSYVSDCYSYLIENLSGGVALLLGCCGAPAEWAGREDLFQKQVRLLLETWDKLGQPKVILACPTCLKLFKKYLPQVPAEMIWQVIEKVGWQSLPPNEKGKTLALHDPCASRYDKETQDCVRRILIKLGYQIEELPLNREKTTCCSFGGLVATVNKDLAAKIAAERISASPRDYVTYCVNCRDDFARLGKKTWHLLDLIFASKYLANASAQLSVPSYSQKRMNRQKLKRNLLQNIWGIEMKEEQNAYPTVIISSELEEKMDQDLILVEDVRQVLYNAEQNGKNIVLLENGHLMAHWRIGLITYWVEYRKTEKANCFEIINTYSHRMQIIEE